MGGYYFVENKEKRRCKCGREFIVLMVVREPSLFRKGKIAAICPRCSNIHPALQNEIKAFLSRPHQKCKSCGRTDVQLLSNGYCARCDDARFGKEPNFWRPQK